MALYQDILCAGQIAKEAGIQNKMDKSDNKKKIKKLINIAGRVITVLSLLFVVRAIYRLGFDLSAIKNIPEFIAVGLASSIVFATGVYIQALAWKSWLSFFAGKVPCGREGKGADREECEPGGRVSDPEDMGDGNGVSGISTKEALCVYARANIGKYLPGNVMHYVERNLFAARSGVSQSAVALSSVFEIGSQVAVALLVAFLSAGDTVFKMLDVLFGENWQRIALIAFGAGLLLFAAAVCVAFRIFGEKLKKLFSGYSISGFILTLIRAMLLYLTVMLIGGCIMAVLYMHMGGSVTAHSLFVIISGYVIAWVLGFVVPGSPGGIGVREFVLTMTVGPVVGQELVLTLMVIHRLINIVGDFAAYLIQALVSKNGADKEGSIQEKS